MRQASKREPDSAEAAHFGIDAVETVKLEPTPTEALRYGLTHASRRGFARGGSRYSRRRQADREHGAFP